jgi:multicomponent K+:H+ antiporter subunit E
MKVARQLLPHPVLSLSLLVIWLMLNQSVDPGHLLLGAGLGVALPLLSRRYWPERPPFHRFPLLWKLFFQVNWDILWACITVAWLTFTRRSASLQPQFAAIPLESSNPYALALLVGIITITPGTVAADLDPQHRLLLVHWLHEPDPERAARRIKSRYEKPLKEILE